MTTRREILLLLRKRPGSTVAEMAAHLGFTAMGVRRHIDVLAAEGLVEAAAVARRAVGRPPTGWRLTPAGDEEFPRRYDDLAADLLEEVAENGGAAVMESVLAGRSAKLAARYEASLGPMTTLGDRVERLTALREDDGYLAECRHDEGGDLLLVENNCAVWRVARRFPVLCAMELSLFRQCLGPGAEVTRESHALSGDAVCCYRVRPAGEGDAR